MRDAVMPECCNTCVCSEGYGCGITGTEMTTKEMESRPDWCPLEEVESCDDAVSREAVSSWLKQYGQDVLHGKYKFSLMYIWKNLMDLPSVQPEINCSEIPNSSDTISRQAAVDKFIDELEEIFSDIREREVDDSVCGLCEYDGAYIGQSGDWCNECPGFDRDDCFKLSDKIRKEWTDEIIKALPSVQPEQTEMIKEIRRWINSGNRGNADYFIVDKIEEILNKYE